MDKMQQYALAGIARGASFWEILRDSPFPMADLIRTLNSLYSSGGIFAKSGKLALARGSAIPSPLPSQYHFPGGFHSGMTNVFKRGKGFSTLLHDFRKAVKGRPEPHISFLQGYMTEEDVVKRVAFMHSMCDVHGKRIALIGDDDLLSIALALTGMPSEITVFDIDTRLGKFIRGMNASLRTKIRFVKYDVSAPVPPKFLHVYDTFSTEPLESPSGLHAFLVRGTELLSTKGVGYFGLTTLEASPSKWLRAERLLCSKRCAITDVARGFSAYPFTAYGGMGYEEFAKRLKFPVGKNPRVNWYRSSLVRFEKLGESPTIKSRLEVAPFDATEELTHPSARGWPDK